MEQEFLLIYCILWNKNTLYIITYCNSTIWYLNSIKSPPLTNRFIRTLRTLLLFQKQVINCLSDGSYPEFLVILGPSVGSIRSLWCVNLNSILIDNCTNGIMLSHPTTSCLVSKVYLIITANFFKNPLFCKSDRSVFKWHSKTT